MIGEVLEVGDKVKVVLPRGSRASDIIGYSHRDVGSVVGFDENYVPRIWQLGVRPGVYLNRCYPMVEFNTRLGESVVSVSDSHLEPVDGRHFTAKIKKYKAEGWEERRGRKEGRNFIRELPDTPFWEGDVVKLKKPVTGLPREGVVRKINFYMADGQDPEGKLGSPYVIGESLDVTGGISMGAHENDLDLLMRGDVWRYYHRKAIFWKSLKAEADFFHLIGRVVDCWRVAESWRQDDQPDRYDEAIKALKDGKVDGFRSPQGLGFFRGLDGAQGYHFRDRELGDRVARSTLAGLGVV